MRNRLPGRPGKGMVDDPARARAQGREAYARRAWEDAHAALSQADEAGLLEADDLERLAWCAALTGRQDEFLKDHERLYRLHLSCGDDVRAARSAFWIGFRLFSLGETGRATGWLGRAGRLIEGRDCVEQGYVLLPAVHRHLAAGDIASAREAAARAAGIGVRFGDRDLAGLARALEGQVLVRQQRMEEGLAPPG